MSSKLLEFGRAVSDLPDALRTQLDRWAKVDPPPPRLVTAGCGADLVRLLAGLEPTALVRALAAFSPVTSAPALARSLATASEVLRHLRDAPMWTLFEQVRHLDPKFDALKSAILARLAVVLSADELADSFLTARAKLIQETSDLLHAVKPAAGGARPEPDPAPESPPPKPGRWHRVRHVESGGLGQALADLTQEALSADGGDGGGRLQVTLTVERVDDGAS